MQPPDIGASPSYDRCFIAVIGVRVGLKEGDQVLRIVNGAVRGAPVADVCRVRSAGTVRRR